MKPIEKRTRERIENNPKIRLFRSFLWDIKERELKIFIKDILEEQVDPKYYLSEKLQERFSKYLNDKYRICNLQPRSPTRPSLLKNPSAGGSGLLTKNDGTSYFLDQNNTQGVVFDKSQGKVTKEIYEVNPKNDIQRPSYLQYQNGNHSELHRVYSSEGISQTMKPHGLKIYKEPEVSNCLDANIHKGTTPKGFYDKSQRNIVGNGMLRKLTPKECFRLMGFLNDEINLDGLSDSQRYKLAGNGWDINLASKIFKEMLK